MADWLTRSDKSLYNLGASCPLSCVVLVLVFLWSSVSQFFRKTESNTLESYLFQLCACLSSKIPPKANKKLELLQKIAAALPEEYSVSGCQSVVELWTFVASRLGITALDFVALEVLTCECEFVKQLIHTNTILALAIISVESLLESYFAQSPLTGYSCTTCKHPRISSSQVIASIDNLLALCINRVGFQ